MRKTVTIAVVTLVLTSFLLVQTPMAYSTELTSPEKTLVILKDVVGLDTAAYSTTLELDNQVLDYKGLPQEDLKYTLKSEESKLEVICTFVNEKLRTINIYPDGSPRITQQAASTVEMAKNFINKYQTISNASYYGTFVSMLDNVEENKNVTKTSENMKLKVIYTTNYTSYRWIYTVDGIEAPSKCVALKFEKGFLKYFIDNWSLYTIGSTDINLSEEEAIKIAMDRTENHSWNVSMSGDNPPLTITEFNIAGVSETKLAFGNYATNNESRDGDPLTLYPGWQIKLYFDKLYPGSVYGVDIGIWADTGEVNDISELLFLGDYSSNPDVDGNGDSIELESNEEVNDETRSNMPTIAWTSLPIAAVLVITIVYYKREKKRPREMHNGSESYSLKLSGALLCLLILLTMFPMAISPVKAGTYVMPLYGSRCNGTITPAEESAAHSVINVWESYFQAYAGYTVYDLFGSATQKQTVLDHADAFEDYFDHVAMFHYGHGGKNFANGHYDYFDDDGWNGSWNLIWDYEIYQETSSSKHFFVVLWSCRQGDIIYGGQDGLGKKGMPYAWFHGYPSSGDCFIGFKDASMPLTQKSANSTWCKYDLWLKMVGIRLSASHATVIGALNQASNHYFNCDYDETELYLGFTAYWEGFGSGPGKMRVYGNWNIKVW